MNRMSLINVRDLYVSFPGRKVLNGVSIEVQPHERLGLSGPVGSGKSTLLHCIAGLITAQRGSIEVFGRVCRTESDFEKIRGRVAMLFQDSDDQLFCPTVEEDVAFGPLNAGHSRSEALDVARETLAKLDLQNYGSRLIHTLSGGEKRLVALAGVLAMSPEVLLLDEPTTGLDEHFSRRFEAILLESNLACLIVSHDQAFLERVAQRRLRLSDGHVYDLSN